MSRYKIIFLTIYGLTLFGCAQLTSNEKPENEAAHENRPKNIIMVVTDGMGPAYTSMFRNFKDNTATPEVEPTLLDKMFVGKASTYPAPESGFVTDSAAAATALATGVKSYNGAIGVDVNKQPLQSVMHYAKSLGMKTGIAVTSQIVHATPASYIAHNESRNNYNDIADSYFDDRIEGAFIADVMLGGGLKYFERQDRDLVAEFVDAGYEFANSYNDLASVPKGSKVLGLFAPVGLPWVLDDTRKNRLAYLTRQAVKHLENDEGFFLLVEASQVDWAGHANDVASAMAEMTDMALMIEFLYEYVESHPDTLVVMTADHSTGGLSIGAKGVYEFRPQFLKNLKASPDTIAKALPSQANPVGYLNDMLGFELSETEAVIAKNWASLTNPADIALSIKYLIDVRSNTGWTTGGHTGLDVEVFAHGQSKSLFYGHYDNTDIAKKIFTLLSSKEIDMPVTKQKEKETNAAHSGCQFHPDRVCED